MMRDQMQSRLEVLRQEFETGQARLRELERQESVLRETMLRISGAIQVLEELLAQGNGERTNGMAEIETAGSKAN